MGIIDQFIEYEKSNLNFELMKIVYQMYNNNLSKIWKNIAISEWSVMINVYLPREPAAILAASGLVINAVDIASFYTTIKFKISKRNFPFLILHNKGSNSGLNLWFKRWK